MAFTALKINVRTRLSLSFFSAIALTGIACLIASLSLYKLRTTLDLIIGQHLPIIIAAYELIQRSEATVANTHNLAVASTRGQRQTVYYRTHDQFAHAGELVARLKDIAALQSTLPLARIAEAHAYLSATFEKLNTAVEQHMQQHQPQAVLLQEFIHKRHDLSQEFDSSAAEYTQAPNQAIAINTVFCLALDVLVTRVMSFKRHDMEAHADIASLAAVLRHLRPAHKSLVIALDRLISQDNENLYCERQISKKIDSLLLLYSQRSGRLIAALNELIIYSRAAINLYSKYSDYILRIEGVLLVSNLVFAMIATTLLVARLSHSIGHRLSHLSQAVEVAATGKEVKIDSHGGDEIANIARAVEGLITMRRQAEESLRVAKDAADNANMAKTRLLASASHDLRQPLQALGLFVTALLDFHLTAETRTIAEKISLSVTTLRELLDALLDISKLDSGVVVPNRTAIPLASLIDRLVPEFQPVATAKNLRFLVGSCRGYVISDPVLLDRMLRNLLANAIRYTNMGGVLIGCRHRGRYIRVEIWDSGPGISPEQRREIFREFHRVNHSSENAGVGLGLAIVDRTARLLGHRILVESRLGRGSMFAVEVEAATALEVAQKVRNGIRLATASSSEKQGPSAPSVLSGRAIVVIDTDPLIRQSLQLLLKGWGCTVVTADSGDTAVVELSRYEVVPEAIIADYWLGNGETGNRAIATLREAVDRPLPALLTLAEELSAPNGLLHKAQTHGLPVLRKPVTSKQLLAFLEKAFTGQKTTD